MGNLYYDLETNITFQKEDIFPTCIDHFIFQTADGNYLEVESQGYDEFTHNNGNLNGSWTDHVKYRRLDPALVSIDDDFHEIDDDAVFYTLISAASTKLVGFRVDEESLDEHGYDADFVPKCTIARVHLMFIRPGHQFVEDKDFEAENLRTDDELIRFAQETLGYSGGVS